jgi:hypothetical protein
VFGSCFFQFPGLQEQFHMLLTKHASAVLSTGVSGVRGTPGHSGTRPAMSDAGAELDVEFVQPGCQHRQHSSTNAPTCKECHTIDIMNRTVPLTQ